MILPYCVYILFSKKDHLLYVGHSSDLKKRVLDHNEGKTKSTVSRRPLELIFCEYYIFKEDAIKREKYFKTSMGKKAIRLMLSSTLEKLRYKNPSQKIQIIFDQDSDIE